MGSPTSDRASGGLLAVHAHPDDETLTTGALLATWAAAGRPVTVVTCTRGERGEVLGDGLAHLEGDGPALAAHRTGELARALDALGVRDHVWLDEAGAPAGATGRTGPSGPDDAAGPDGAAARYEDSGMAWVRPGLAGAADGSPPAHAFVAAGLDDAAARLADVVVRRRPDVVVTYEPGGGYGHPDHVRAHEVTRRALDLAAPRHRVAALLWAVVPEPALRAAYARLAEVAPTTFPAHLRAPGQDPLPSAAVRRTEVDLAVEVAPVLPRVLGALRAHATQVQAAREVPGSGASGTDVLLLAACALSNDVLLPVLAQESYRLAPDWPAAEVAWPTGVARVA